MVKTLCIVQARLTSSRLPNKVLMELGNTGKSVLNLVYERLQKAKSIDKIIYAIPDTTENDLLASYLESKNIDYFRGSEDNVLKRFYECAQQYNPEIIVRATCDNPCVDWNCCDYLVSLVNQYDYLYPSDAPIGVGAEVFTFKALQDAYFNATNEEEMEHVCPYIYQHNDLYRIFYPKYNLSVPHYRLTLDTKEDLELITSLYSKLYCGQPIQIEDIYKHLSDNPDLLLINRDVVQKVQ